MPIIEDIVGSEAAAAAGLAAGSVVALTLIRRVLRPAAKAIIKTGIVLYRGTADVIGEATQIGAPAAAAPETVEAPPARARRATAGSKPGFKRRTRPAASRRDGGKKG